ncbi:MAG: DegT/DnrJ/EryC1/StrS family aminotransferase [Myxococcota bacterium]
MTEPPVPLLDLQAHHAPLIDELGAALERVLTSNRFILGPEVQAFEAEVAGQLGVGHAVGVSSGTDALLAALMALEVGPGDEVITTPFSFFATAGCIARLGARPVFVDIDPGTFNLDVSQVAGAVTPRTRAVLPVHLFGQPYDVVGLHRALAGRDLPIVEDAAQAIGAITAEGPVGGLGTFGCFSFFPSKNLGCLGDGGLVTTNDAAFAERVCVLRGHGAQPKYHHPFVGGNFRLDAIQAAVLRVLLPHLPSWTAARRDNAARYDRMIADDPVLRDTVRPPRRIQDGHVYNQYVVRVPRRDDLRKFLASRGIGSEVYYPLPLHLQECFRALGYRRGDLPESERASREVLALPVYPELGEEAQRRVTEAMREFYAA